MTTFGLVRRLHTNRRGQAMSRLVNRNSKAQRRGGFDHVKRTYMNRRWPQRWGEWLPDNPSERGS